MAAIARFCQVLLAALIVVAGPATADAQISSTRPYASLFVIAGADAIAILPERETLRRAIEQAEVPVSADAGSHREPKFVGGALTAMYGGLVTLQALDAHSTFRALDAGLDEANPLMRWASSHPVAFVSAKAAATAGTVYVVERIRKKHPKRAIVFIAAINATYAFVVAHNYKASSRAR